LLSLSLPATDNPLVDAETGFIHHGGNFQAMTVMNAMKKTRLALHHIGKLLFAQSTELCNPTMNNGLPPATAAYVAELGHLVNPVSTHIQSAEMHNQAVKYVLIFFKLPQSISPNAVFVLWLIVIWLSLII
jgi:phenylalanine ammonia-lyase